MYLLGRLLRELIVWLLGLIWRLGVLVARWVAALAVRGIRWTVILASWGFASLWTGPEVAAQRIAAAWEERARANGIPVHHAPRLAGLMKVCAWIVVILSLLALSLVVGASVLVLARIALPGK